MFPLKVKDNAYEVKKAYHQLDISDFLKIKDSFSMQYKLKFNKFYSKGKYLTPLPKEEESFKYKPQKIPILSYSSEEWSKKNLCTICGEA